MSRIMDKFRQVFAKRTCRTCDHKGTSPYKYPCLGCFDSEAREHWTPKQGDIMSCKNYEPNYEKCKSHEPETPECKHDWKMGYEDERYIMFHCRKCPKVEVLGLSHDQSKSLRDKGIKGDIHGR